MLGNHEPKIWSHIYVFYHFVSDIMKEKDKELSDLVEEKNKLVAEMMVGWRLTVFFSFFVFCSGKPTVSTFSL